MNIFRLDDDPRKAARYHNDRHVVKMILESAQLLSTAHHVFGGAPSGILRLTHVNHPCAVWVRESTSAYRWVHDLMSALLDEYTFRYGKTHQYDAVAGTWAALALPPAPLPHVPAHAPPQCMPSPYQRTNDPVQAYREYYFAEKQHLAQWKRRGVPQWWTEMEMKRTLRSGT